MNKTVLITGSSRGIGASLGIHLAQAGYRVVINYASSAEQAHSVIETITQKVGPNRAICIQADVSRRDDVQWMFDQIQAQFGQVDVLINNAGINIDGPFLEMSDEQWSRVTGTILNGTFICSQEFARRYEGSEGQIVNMGATTGFRGRKNGANYCSARAGVNVLTKCMALELAPHIRVNCVVPGYIDTEELMTRYNLSDPERRQQIESTIPLGRLGTPDDICKTVLFLIRDAEYITGQNFFVNGGYFMY